MCSQGLAGCMLCTVHSVVDSQFSILKLKHKGTQIAIRDPMHHSRKVPDAVQLPPPRVQPLRRAPPVATRSFGDVELAPRRIGSSVMSTSTQTDRNHTDGSVGMRSNAVQSEIAVKSEIGVAAEELPLADSTRPPSSITSRSHSTLMTTDASVLADEPFIPPTQQPGAFVAMEYRGATPGGSFLFDRHTRRHEEIKSNEAAIEAAIAADSGVDDDESESDGDSNDEGVRGLVAIDLIARYSFEDAMQHHPLLEEVVRRTVLSMGIISSNRDPVHLSSSGAAGLSNSSGSITGIKVASDRVSEGVRRSGSAMLIETRVAQLGRLWDSSHRLLQRGEGVTHGANHSDTAGGAQERNSNISTASAGSSTSSSALLALRVFVDECLRQRGMRLRRLLSRERVASRATSPSSVTRSRSEVSDGQDPLPSAMAPMPTNSTVAAAAARRNAPSPPSSSSIESSDMFTITHNNIQGFRCGGEPVEAGAIVRAIQGTGPSVGRRMRSQPGASERSNHLQLTPSDQGGRQETGDGFSSAVTSTVGEDPHCATVAIVEGVVGPSSHTESPTRAGGDVSHFHHAEGEEAVVVCATEAVMNGHTDLNVLQGVGPAEGGGGEDAAVSAEDELRPTVPPIGNIPTPTSTAADVTGVTVGPPSQRRRHCGVPDEEKEGINVAGATGSLTAAGTGGPSGPGKWRGIAVARDGPQNGVSFVAVLHEEAFAVAPKDVGLHVTEQHEEKDDSGTAAVSPPQFRHLQLPNLRAAPRRPGHQQQQLALCAAATKSTIAERGSEVSPTLRAASPRQALILTDDPHYLYFDREGRESTPPSPLRLGLVVGSETSRRRLLRPQSIISSTVPLVSHVPNLRAVSPPLPTKTPRRLW